MDYKKQHLLKDRVNESNRIIRKYPNHIPVIVECNKELNKLIAKKKFLVPNDITVSHLLYVIRKQLSIEPCKATFIFCDNILLCSSSIMVDVYNEYKLRNKIDYDSDNFMYILLIYENTFG